MLASGPDQLPNAPILGPSRPDYWSLSARHRLFQQAEVFSEVRTGLRQVASCLGWKGMPPPEKGVGKDKASCRTLCLDKKTPSDLILRAGLRALVVALDPVRLRPLSGAHRLLRPLPRRARRAGHHPRQERD